MTSEPRLDIIGAALGAVFAVIFQPQAVVGLASVTDMSTAMALLKGVWMSMFDGYVSHSGDEVIDSLLSKGGMSSMLNTVWLILSCLVTWHQRLWPHFGQNSSSSHSLLRTSTG